MYWTPSRFNFNSRQRTARIFTAAVWLTASLIVLCAVAADVSPRFERAAEFLVVLNQW